MVKRPSSWLAATLAAHLLLGLIYDWATPIFEASDEGWHYAVVHWLAGDNPLPVQNPDEPDSAWAQEGSQPPLYYVLGGGLTAWVGSTDFDRVFVQNPFARVGVPGTAHNVNLYRHAMSPVPLAGSLLAAKLVRWLSLALSCITVLLTFRLARLMAPQDDSLALLAAALVAFNPMALFINASVNNDNLLMLLSTVALIATLHLMQPAVTRYEWKAAGLGLLLGLAALTKLSGLVLWPIAALGVAWGAWRARDWRRFVLSGALIGATALLVSGWWYWRNYQLYGEWTGLETMVAVAGPRVPAVGPFQLIRDEWYGFWLSYWGVFGVFNVLAAPWVNTLFAVLSLWPLAGAVAAIWRTAKGRRIGISPEWALLILFASLTLAGVVRWTMQTFASQGRLMFGAIAPISILMAGGIQATLPSGWRRWANAVLIGVMVLVAAIIPFAYIAPRYAPPRALAESELPGNLRPVRVRLGSEIELLGFTADDGPRRPGESQPVTLYWRSLQPGPKDHALALHLLGQDNTEIGKIDTWPGGGNAPTSKWTEGRIYADTYAIPLSPQASTPSILKLNLAFWDDEPGNTLPLQAPDGTSLHSITLPVGRLVPWQAPHFTPALVEGSRFEYGISLLGIDVREGGSFTLYWQTDQPIPADYTLFLHLLDSNGAQLAQADGPPLGGDWPTMAWVPGDPFADPRHFDLPSDLAAGRYTLHLGWYDPSSGARLAAFRSDGTQWPDDIVVIENALEFK